MVTTHPLSSWEILCSISEMVQIPFGMDIMLADTDQQQKNKRSDEEYSEV